MQIEFRKAAARLRAIGKEILQPTVRERLLELAREFEQSADIRDAMQKSGAPLRQS